MSEGEARMSGEMERLVGLWEKANQVIALTGAGISTESGLPDFRSEGGIWEGVDPEIACSLRAFQTDPAEFWRFYRARLSMSPEVEPNSAHYALAELQRYGLRGIVTQNIDGLHQRAGSRRVLEVHGNARTVSCPRCGEKKSWEEAHQEVGEDGVPRCQYRHPMKPDVILFGEDLPGCAHTAMAWCHDADLILVCGSSLRVEPVASWTLLNRARGGSLAILTDSPTPRDRQAKVRLGGPLTASLGELLSRISSSSRAGE